MGTERNNLNSKPAESGSVNLLPAAICLVSSVCMPAAAVGQQQLDEDLMFSDWEQKAMAVNEGELTLLEMPPEQPVHQHINHLIIDEASLDSGWVSLRQCHHGLDSVPALQITFAAGRVRDLTITDTSNIERSWVEGHSVQLRNISDGSSLCLSARTLALKPGEDTVVLSNGPYMRRFLDGFYPMHVELKVSYPVNRLSFNQSSPLEFEQLEAGEILLDVLFEGELRTTVFFDRI